MSLIDNAILDFYTQSSEDTRLQVGLGPLELERNKALIARHLPDYPCRIADVGGGTGHYARWLSSLGHAVTLIDPVPRHVDLARRKAAHARRTFACVLGEARRLPLPKGAVDVVMLHGPLYHLQDAEDRQRALYEAQRVLRVGGVVLGFAITHAASVLAALQTGMIHDPDVFRMCLQSLANGEHYPPPGMPGVLPRSFFHRPAGLREEFEMAGFTVEEVVAVEGIAWLDQRYFESWAHPEKRQRLLELVRRTEADPDLLALSPHIMLAAGVK
ncbi:class I SAM-dependent methyltransferase [Parachryseolinea silvisoli]|uniref:class I SAM-dependent methyltransferase n=1 Tax=Parachryseolinea silvisoli TaxID=2873601 RepID=UPI002265BF87|nr:class I SAM-dependent methyltransferase [Parachryseolinea silvisoli]MCD9018897.1 class I SAM-dependent methyltransferase [Parachryseolinea silvisoli]